MAVWRAGMITATRNVCWCPCGRVRIVLRSNEKTVKLLKVVTSLLLTHPLSSKPSTESFYLNSQSQQSLPYSNAVKQTAVIKKLKLTDCFCSHSCYIQAFCRTAVASNPQEVWFYGTGSKYSIQNENSEDMEYVWLYGLKYKNLSDFKLFTFFFMFQTS